VPITLGMTGEGEEVIDGVTKTTEPFQLSLERRRFGPGGSRYRSQGDRLTLRFRDYPKLPKFARHRAAVALISATA